MKENNNRNDGNRPANKNIKTIAVIVVVAITIILVISLSMRSTTMIGAQMGGGNKPIIMHFHPILTITVDGKPMTVPGQIGIDPLYGKIILWINMVCKQCLMACQVWLHYILMMIAVPSMWNQILLEIIL